MTKDLPLKPWFQHQGVLREDASQVQIQKMT